MIYDSYGAKIIEVLEVENRESDDLVKVLLDNGSEVYVCVEFTPLDMLEGLELDDVL